MSNSTAGFIETPVATPKRELNTRVQNKAIRNVFKNMSDTRVLWLVITHLGYKRRVGLLMSAIVLYFGWDHHEVIARFVGVVF